MAQQTLRDKLREAERERAELDIKSRQEASDIRAVAATPEGRRFLRWLVNHGGIFSGDFSPSSNNAFNDGRRSVSVAVWNRLREHAERKDFIEICMGEN
jgi:hypothetical protein